MLKLTSPSTGQWPRVPQTCTSVAGPPVRSVVYSQAQLTEPQVTPKTTDESATFWEAVETIDRTRRSLRPEKNRRIHRDFDFFFFFLPITISLHKPV